MVPETVVSQMSFDCVKPSLALCHIVSDMCHKQVVRRLHKIKVAAHVRSRLLTHHDAL